MRDGEGKRNTRKTVAHLRAPHSSALTELRYAPTLKTKHLAVTMTSTTHELQPDCNRHIQINYPLEQRGGSLAGEVIFSTNSIHLVGARSRKVIIQLVPRQLRIHEDVHTRNHILRIIERADIDICLPLLMGIAGAPNDPGPTNADRIHAVPTPTRRSISALRW